MSDSHICTRCITLRIRGDLEGVTYTTYIPEKGDLPRCLHRWHPVDEKHSIAGAHLIGRAIRDRRKLNALDWALVYSLIAGTVLALAFNLTGA